MKALIVRVFILSLFCVCVSNITGGQSLIMSGSEIFEQEPLPKNKATKSLKSSQSVEQKYIKQKGIIIVPNLKKGSVEQKGLKKLSELPKTKEKVTHFTEQEPSHDVHVSTTGNPSRDLFWLMISYLIKMIV